MMRLYRAQHLVEASHIKNLLDSAGIRAFLRNENLVRLSGEVPFDRPGPRCGSRTMHRRPPRAAFSKTCAKPLVTRLPGPAPNAANGSKDNSAHAGNAVQNDISSFRPRNQFSSLKLRRN